MSLVKCSGCQSYFSSELTKCPKCGQVVKASSKTDAEEEYWLKNNKTISGIKSYQYYYPNGRHIQECKSLLKQYKRRSNKADAKEISHAVKALIKYGGLTLCAILTIVVIITCIETRAWPASGTIAPIYIASRYLGKWEI